MFAALSQFVLDAEAGQTMVMSVAKFRFVHQLIDPAFIVVVAGVNEPTGNDGYGSGDHGDAGDVLPALAPGAWLAVRAERDSAV